MSPVLAVGVPEPLLPELAVSDVESTESSESSKFTESSEAGSQSWPNHEEKVMVTV